MFLPLHDQAPMRRLAGAYVTWGVIAVTVAAWAVSLVGDENVTALRFGTIPAVLFGKATLAEAFAVLPAPATLISALLVHGSLWHLGANMLFLWVFGDNVEDAMGHVRFLVFYLACGILAGLAHAAIDPASRAPLIGASGAVSGIVMAYAMLYPRAWVFGLFLKGIPLVLRASWAIGFWMLVQLIQALGGGDAGVAWFAHLGGILAGALLVRPLIARDVRLFGR